MYKVEERNGKFVVVWDYNGDVVGTFDSEAEAQNLAIQANVFFDEPVDPEDRWADPTV